MLEEWRTAWRQAVDNFWRELRSDDEADPRLGAMRREISDARTELHRLSRELDRARRRLERERRELEACRRRERLARDIGDADTARVAAEFGARHGARADVLARKVDALEAEYRLAERELEDMRAALIERSAQLGAGLDPKTPDEEDEERERPFRDLETRDRERAAQERLDELKRRMS